MSITLREPPDLTAGAGGIIARRAVARWGWRLFRREWRQQLLVLGLLTVAVAATILGASAVTNAQLSNPNYATFGTAAAQVTLPGTDPRLAADIAAIAGRWGPADVIEDQDIATGATQPVQLRAENPRGHYTSPLLGLVSGAYPAGPGQAALTTQVAALYGAHVGGTWHAVGTAWRVTGIVQDPSNLPDEFALVAPGQVRHPSQVIMLLGSPAVRQAIGNGSGTLPGVPAAATVTSPNASSGGISPAVLVLVVEVLGLVFIGLVAVAGFSVMAQHRLRALGVLSAIGATERNLRLVMITGGLAVGVAGALAGAVLGLAAWVAYAPTLQQATGHVVDAANVPWWAFGIGVVFAIATSVLASRRPAKTVAAVPVVAALSGRPGPPKPVHRSALPGVIVFAGGVACLVFTGGWSGGGGGGGGGRDALLLLVASIQFGNPLNWFGSNLSSSQLIFYSQASPAPGMMTQLSNAQLASLGRQVDSYAAGLHAQSVLPLEASDVSLDQVSMRGPHDHFNGSVYVATPQLLAAYGINASQVGPGTDILTMRPGLASLPYTEMVWSTAGYQHPGQGFPGSSGNPPCTLSNDCVANLGIQTVSALPGGTSAPNTVITEHAIVAWTSRRSRGGTAHPGHQPRRGPSGRDRRVQSNLRPPPLKLTGVTW